MQLKFWVLHLRFSVLVKILRKSKGNGNAGITYINGTKPGVFFLRILKKLKIITAPVIKIKPRDSVAGPVLNLAFVRNDRGEVITIGIYHHILALRREIADYLFHAYKHFFFVKKQKYLTMLYAYLSLRIAKDISPAVYFANYARWKDYHETTGERPSNVMFIPKSDWSAMVAANLGQIVDQVVIDKPENGFSQKIQVLKHIFSAFIKLGPVLAFGLMGKKGTGTELLTDLSFQGQLKKNKIMVPYAMGISSGQRSDLSYFHASDIKPEQLLIYVRSQAHLPSEAELQWILGNNAQCVANPSVTKTKPGMQRWQETASMKLIKREFYGLYIHTVGEARRCKAKHSWWLLDKLWDMGMEMAYWKDLFLANQVGILVHSNPSDNNFLPVAALSEIGGIAVECERTIRFDYCTFIHNMPHHVNFLSGPYSLTQVPEPSFSLFSIISSNINIENGNEGNTIADLDAVDRSKIILAVFDESANDVFGGDSIRQLYEAMIELIKSDERFFLLIKTKKPKILEKMADLKKEISQFCEKGRCLCLDWKVSASSAAVHADLVVSVPSTAAFESVSAGAKTVVFNPQRSGSKIFYTNNGHNRRIFEDSPTMIEAIKEFANGGDDSIGDCRDIAVKVDGFRDGQGARRVGDYLQWCLDALEAGVPQEEVIRTANQRYAEQWGEDKITNRNSFEFQVAPHFQVSNRNK